MRRLLRCKGDHACIEGPHLITEALAAGLRPETVLATPEFLDQSEGRSLTDELAAEPIVMAPELLESLADADSPRGILAVVQLPRGGAEILPRSTDGIYLYVDALQDPGNLGALARVAEAFGVLGMALAPGTVHPNHPRALRASAGSLLRIPIAVGVGADELDHHLAGERLEWVALVPRGGLELEKASLPSPMVLALGAEGPGLDSGLVARSHHQVTIPVDPPVESLNAAVAASLVLYEIRRRAGAELLDSPRVMTPS